MNLPPDSHAGLVRLDWDTQHFGCPVARLEPDRLDDERLAAALSAARQQGIRLVYWFASPECRPGAALLGRFTGRLVDRRITLRLALGADFEPTEEALLDYELAAWPVAPASPELARLGATAGSSGRFARDPLVPLDRRVALYETWMDRSARGELADLVITARRAGKLLGTITARRSGTTGSIGLLAVAAAAQRRGVGSALVRATANWLVRGGGTALDVVTQLDNQPATALYARVGFQPYDLQHVFHFWPGDAAS
jgi:ribosomal protein S18 acetylase RimI-like enzyme